MRPFALSFFIGQSKIECVLTSAPRTELFRFTPPADKPGQRLHRRLRRIQIDPFVRVVRIASARAEQQRWRVEMSMENEHVAWPSDAPHQRSRARDLPESFGKLRHDRMPWVNRRPGQEFNRKARLRLDREQIGSRRDGLLEPREELLIYRFKLLAWHALPIQLDATADGKRDRLSHSPSAAIDFGDPDGNRVVAARIESMNGRVPFSLVSKVLDSSEEVIKLICDRRRRDAFAENSTVVSVERDMRDAPAHLRGADHLLARFCDNGRIGVVSPQPRRERAVDAAELFID